MCNNIRLKGKVETCFLSHFLLSIIVLFILLLASTQHLSGNAIKTDENVLIPFLMIGGVFILALALNVLLTSFFNPQTSILFGLLCLLVLGVELDILFLILPYPIITIFMVTHLKSKNIL